MKKPTFFISSTIYDFADLRSALKYNLEAQGCQVLASEFNDFRKSLDSHSYQECLNSIQRADYFILLVGSRVGGWYDEKNRVSITRKEFQEAYKLHIAGKLKIITFVRSEIWDLRSDRNELAKFLEKLELEREKTNSIKNYASKHAQDPEFIIDFLNEISRNEETKGAVKGENAFPSANWIHKFNSFRDIADVLNPLIFDGEPIEDAVMKKLLLKELRHFLSISLIKINEKSGVHAPIHAIKRFYQNHTIDLNNKDYESFYVKKENYDAILSLSLHLLLLKYQPLILPQALKSSTFIAFDHRTNEFVETALFKALSSLQREIQLFSEHETMKAHGELRRHSPARRDHRVNEIEVNTLDFFTIMFALQRWSNIIELTKSIVRTLQGESFTQPDLFGRSPIQGMNEEFAKETVTEADLDQFLKRS